MCECVCVCGRVGTLCLLLTFLSFSVLFNVAPSMFLTVMSV